MTHSDSDLKSALQKFIRRGMDKEVLSVGNEICNRMILSTNFQMWDAFWRRLHVIASEDIGVAQRDTHTYLKQSREEADTYFLSSDNKEKARRHCLEAILTLSRSPKSRLTDSAYIYWERHQITPVSQEILHQAIQDKDEPRLLQLIASVYRQRNHKKARIKVSNVIQAVQSYITNDLRYEFESVQTAYHVDACVLYLMHMGLLLCRPPAKTCMWQAVTGSLPPPALTDDLLPDFVYDKHTRRGRDIYHRGIRHFLEHGCILNNCSIADPYYDMLLKEVPFDEN